MADEWVDDKPDEWVDDPPAKVKPGPGMDVSGLRKDINSKLNTAAASVGQVGTLGFGDEMVGGYKALMEKILPKSMGGSSLPLGDLYRLERDTQRAQYANAMSENPKTAIGTGLAAGMMLPFGRAKNLADAVKYGAALGGVTGLGSSDADLTKGDVGGAAKDTAMGAWTGGALGFATHGLANGLQSMRPWAQRTAAGALRGTAGDYQRLLDRGELESMGKVLLDKKIPRYLGTQAGMTERLGPAVEKAGGDVEQAIDVLDANAAPISKYDVSDPLRQEGLRQLKQYGPGARGITQKVLNEADAMDALHPDKLSFRQLVNTRRGYDNQINWQRRNPSQQYGDFEAATAARDAAYDTAQNASPEFAADFKNANQNYHLLAEADRIAGNAEGRSIARNIASPSDKAAAGLGMARAAAKGAGALGTATAGAAWGAGNRFIRNRMASTLAVGANDLSKLGDLPLPQLSTSLEREEMIRQLLAKYQGQQPTE